MATTKVDVNLISATGTPGSGNFLRGDGTWNAAGFTQGTEQATTSGTSFTFGSIPAGVDMVVLTFENVGFTSDLGIDVQIGDSGGIETSGYIQGCVSIQGSTTTAVRAETDRFEMTDAQGSASMGWHGSVFLTLKDSSNFTWIANWCGYTDTATERIGWGAGSKSLSAELTQLQLSGGTFDQGSANIMYM